MEKYKIPCLDHGFVKLLNAAGPIRRPLQDFDADSIDPAKTARISFDKFEEERTREQDLKLVEYLIKNKHCYYETMQVLTTEGWKYWKDLSDFATFLVPNPIDKSLSKELLPIISYSITNEDLFCFKSKKMEYKVTTGHSVYVKGKYEKEFTKQKVTEVTNWGNHDQAGNYSLYSYKGELDTAFSLVGFFLGDGSFCSKNIINFHLKKQRKINYIITLLEKLEIPYTKKQDTYNNSINIFFNCPIWLSNLVDTSFECKYKKLAEGILYQLNDTEVRGLFDGLVNSDGHISESKNRIEFSSVSTHLINLFETLSAFMGLECHKVRNRKDILMVHARFKPEALARRTEYLSKEKYTGKVYCATTSTGLLVVRGNEYSDGYICGNSTPVEMIETWWEMKLPTFLARQFVRHRTSTINEISARYTTLPEEWYIPESVGGKPTNGMKQGQEDNLKLWQKENFKEALNEQCKSSYELYSYYLSIGVAPEHARLFLHVNNYTHWVWKQDLHNLFHFLTLRIDPHAQVEARVYAGAILKLLRTVLPEITDMKFPEKTSL